MVKITKEREETKSLLRAVVFVSALSWVSLGTCQPCSCSK